MHSHSPDLRENCANRPMAVAPNSARHMRGGRTSLSPAVLSRGFGLAGHPWCGALSGALWARVSERVTAGAIVPCRCGSCACRCGLGLVEGARVFGLARGFSLEGFLQ
jgi:hypothetical protein